MKAVGWHLPSGRQREKDIAGHIVSLTDQKVKNKNG
jgi:hypothetical protein